jgi:hypothetical protein
MLQLGNIKIKELYYGSIKIKTAQLGNYNIFNSSTESTWLWDDKTPIMWNSN